MALTDKLTSIANAIRSKTGRSGKLTLDQMVTEINGIKATLQNKTVTPTKTQSTINADAGYDGLGTVTVNAIPSEYIVPSGSATKTANGTYDVTSLAQLVVNVNSGGGLPSGISKIDYGTHVLASDIASNSSTTSQYMFNVKHNLGVTPDLILFYAPSKIDVTYSELFMAWSPTFEYRSSYPTITAYHSNSTTTVSGGSNQSAYCIRDVNASSFNVKTHSSSNYYWRAGTYRWIAIKFG